MDGHCSTANISPAEWVFPTCLHRIDRRERLGEEVAELAVLGAKDVADDIEEESPVVAADFPVVGSFAAGWYAVLPG